MTSVLAAYFRTTRVQIAALLYFLTAGLLTQIPLFNYLGYEFSAVMTIPAALISGIITLQFLKEHRTVPLTKRTWLFVIIDYFHVNFLLLLIPLIVITLNAFVVKNCAYAKGIAFYVLLPLATMIFSVSLALLIGSLFKRSKTIFVFLILLILSQVPLVTYFRSQLFAYNFVMGFFPGITYDETIGDKNTLMLYRQFSLIASLLCILIFSVGIGVLSPDNSVLKNISLLRKTIHTNKLLWLSISVAIISLTAGHLFRSELGFEHSSSDIQRGLGRRSESEHFIFYYSTESYSMKEMIRLKAEAEFHFQTASSRLETGNNKRKKIEVFLYPNAAAKQRYIGTTNTNIAKPWKKEIHLTSATFDDSFRHELIHILAAEFGFPIIRASTRMALNEGLAVAVDWKPGLFTPHQYAAALQREHALDDVVGMFTLSGFAVQSSSYAYPVAGSFCKYLIDRYGITRVKNAFPNGNFMRSFGESLENLVKDWQAFLCTVDATEIPTETVKAYFFHPSIFYKTCAREVAEKNKRAVQALRVKNYTSAEKEFAASYDDAPTAYALRGMMQSLIAQKKYSEAIVKYEELPNGSLLRIHPLLLFSAADAYFLSDNAEKAAVIYAQISAMNISEDYIEASALRKELVTEPAGRELLFALSYSGMEDSLKVTMLRKHKTHHTASFVTEYLLGSLYRGMNKYDEARLSFANVIHKSTNEELLYLANTSAADIEYHSGNYESAKQLYWNAKNYLLTQSQEEYIDERIELCDAVSLAD